ncbi:MAG: hypothetical protein N3F06_04130 [Nitrososphaerales archaeon]|nr:hypothetical protein [Nitrososphaerales archaeon]
MFLNIKDLEIYLSNVFKSKVKVEYFGDLKEKEERVSDIKEYGYGVPLLVTFSIEGVRRQVVISSMRIDRGFGHDYRSDRVSNLILAYDTWNKLPKHARVFDIGGFRKDGGLLSLGEVEEFFILEEKVEGREYIHDLERIYSEGRLMDLDKERVKALSLYLTEIHNVKKDDPELYIRKIRDTVGHGECIFGVADSYPYNLSFLRDGELEEIEKKCIEHRWRLKRKVHRLSQVHGDFHPWNVIFREGIDFTLLDRSRGEFGEPADDVAAMSINYIFFSLRKYGELRGEFQDLYDLFLNTYLEKTQDLELLEALPLFYTFRCLVIASPIWYPTITNEVRRKIFNFAHNILAEKSFEPSKVNSYLE